VRRTGAGREWDVFIAQTAATMCARMAAYRLAGAAGKQQAQRDACYAALRGPVQAHELQRLILRFAIWMNGAYWQQTQIEPHQIESGRTIFATAVCISLPAFRPIRAAPDYLDAERLHACASSPRS